MTSALVPGSRGRSPRLGPRLGWPAASFIAFLVLITLAGPWLAPFSPTAFNPEASLVPPSWPYVFGTDEFGRDVFSRILAGAQPTLAPAFVAAALGIVAGAATGLLCGFLGGRVDEAVMRTMDVLLSFPALILGLLIVTMLGGSTVNLVLAIAVIFWPRSARLVRGAALDLGRREFIDACRARGESTFFILFREMLPNMAGIVIVDFALRISAAILLTASLAYLGIGAQPPTPAWGLMVKEGQQFIQFAPWLTVAPCLTVAAISTGAVAVGEALRRRFSIAERIAR
ncbi:MAG: ABC transporter permease [Pseudochelatococcus sp.]|jgi:peptide/nickel transport system permease protein|uniref:ABC transporter permease n=1 Tax=Pseudochelatococcus sp. TaxID=2020869 RepID=UPI003D8B2A5F